jgi:hypothetical protein
MLIKRGARDRMKRPSKEPDLEALSSEAPTISLPDPFALFPAEEVGHPFER